MSPSALPVLWNRNLAGLGNSQCSPKNPLSLQFFASHVSASSLVAKSVDGMVMDLEAPHGTLFYGCVQPYIALVLLMSLGCIRYHDSSHCVPDRKPKGGPLGDLSSCFRLVQTLVLSMPSVSITPMHQPRKPGYRIVRRYKCPSSWRIPTPHTAAQQLLIVVHVQGDFKARVSRSPFLCSCAMPPMNGKYAAQHCSSADSAVSQNIMSLHFRHHSRVKESTR